MRRPWVPRSLRHRDGGTRQASEDAGEYTALGGLSTSSPTPLITARFASTLRGRRAPRVAFSRDEDLCRHTRGPRAQLVRRRCDGPDPRPAGDADRQRTARQAQADLHPAHRRRRLRDRRQRRADRGDRQQARRQAVLPALRLPGRAEVPHPAGDARPPAGGGHPPGGQGDGSPQPPRPQAADQAQGVRGARPSPRRPAAQAHGDRRLMAETERPDEPEEPDAPAQEEAAEEPAATEQTEGPVGEEPAVAAAEEEAAAEAQPAPEPEQGAQEAPDEAAAEEPADEAAGPPAEVPEEPAADEPVAAPPPAQEAQPAAEEAAPPPARRERRDSQASGPEVIPGADLEPDIVPEGFDPFGRGATQEGLPE